MKNRFPPLLTAGMAVAAISLIPALGLAHGGASGIVKERMNFMKEMGDMMKPLSKMMSGEAPYDAEAVRHAGEVMAKHGGESLTRLFPEGSLHEPTEALPTIWEQPEKFKALADQLTAYGRGLAAAASNPSVSVGAGGQAMGGHAMGGHDMGAMMGGGMPMAGMMGGAPGGMMGAGKPTAEMLAGMPPQAVFAHVLDTCAACHETFRAEKKEHAH